MKGMGLIFGGVGAVLLLIAAGAHVMQRSGTANGVAVTGEVIDHVRNFSSGTYSPVVEFTDKDGKRREFIDNIGSSTPRYSIGEVVNVIYRPSDPNRAAIDDFLGRNFFQMIFGGIGLVFFAIGAGLWLPYVKRQATIRRLKRHSITINAAFLETYQDHRVRINGRSPYRVVAQARHPRTGKLHRFESEMLWVDPHAQLEGTMIKVLSDPETPKKHFIDLSHLTDHE